MYPSPLESSFLWRASRQPVHLQAVCFPRWPMMRQHGLPQTLKAMQRSCAWEPLPKVLVHGEASYMVARVHERRNGQLARGARTHTRAREAINQTRGGIRRELSPVGLQPPLQNKTDQVRMDGRR